ncbi:MAG: autotransporter outer membrane beta-barrel domain-containing protein, partial [Planctomycetota bacterium]
MRGRLRYGQRLVAILLALVGVVGIGVSDARAQNTLTWAGPPADFVPRNFHEAVNWSPMLTPTMVDTVVFNGNNLIEQFFDVYVQGPVPMTPSAGVDALRMRVINAADVFIPTDTIENVPGSRGLVLHAPVDPMAPTLLVDTDGALGMAGPFTEPGEPRPVLDPTIDHVTTYGVTMIGDTGSGEFFADTVHFRTHTMIFGGGSGGNGQATLSAMRLNVDTRMIVGHQGTGDVFGAGLALNAEELHLGLNGGQGTLDLNTQSVVTLNGMPAPGAPALSVGPGSSFILNNSTLVNNADSHIQNNGGQVLVQNQSNFDGIDITSSAGGTFTFSSLSVTGRNQDGAVLNDSGATFNILNSDAAGFSIQSTNGSVNITNSTVSHTTGGTLVNTGGMARIDQQSQVSGIDITNTGIATFTFDSVTVTGKTGGGILLNETGGSFTISNGTGLLDTSIQNTGATMNITNSTVSHGLGGFISNTGGGILNIGSSGLDGIVIENSPGSTLNIDNTSIAPLGPGDPASIVNEGAATITNSHNLFLPIQNRAGAEMTFANSTLNGELFNFGDLKFTDPNPLAVTHATSAINGALVQFTGSSLGFALSPAGSDTLLVNGTATLTGILSLAPAAGLDPLFGQTFTLIDATPVAPLGGDIETVHNPFG